MTCVRPPPVAALALARPEPLAPKPLARANLTDLPGRYAGNDAAPAADPDYLESHSTPPVKTLAEAEPVMADSAEASAPRGEALWGSWDSTADTGVKRWSSPCPVPVERYIAEPETSTKFPTLRDPVLSQCSGSPSRRCSWDRALSVCRPLPTAWLPTHWRVLLPVTRPRASGSNLGLVVVPT